MGDYAFKLPNWDGSDWVWVLGILILAAWKLIDIIGYIITHIRWV